MIRCRFKCKSADDPRPVRWPIKHPYWITGVDIEGTYATLVAYADNEREIIKNWPDSYDLDSEVCEKYTFTDRFQKPEWFKK